jgi:hypothetical protein
MLTAIHPKLPMRNKAITIAFYTSIGFTVFGNTEYEGYIMMERDGLQIHFFAFPDLNPAENYGQIYPIHPNGGLQVKPWGQKEFALLDPDNNLLTFGQDV